jgi:hypothetical protein
MLYMNNEFILPFISKFDPPETSEGSLDPLGLYSIADALGVRLAPGIRERQTTPRFLTLALVGMVACGESYTSDSKGIPSWLVYEWLIVEALVRQLRGTPELQGIPGREKVMATIDANDVVCARNYLKTPSVFGFHGIYRVLGVKAGLFNAEGHPLEFGYRILSAWQAEQGLAGFLDGNGPGRDLRRSFEKAVRKGLAVGQGADLGSEARRLIAEHLHPRTPGPEESDALWAALTHNDVMRGEYALKLISTDGQEAWRQALNSEAEYHTWLIRHVSSNMKQLLMTIRSYELLARLLTDAFDEIRWIMTEERQPVSVEKLGLGPAVSHASQKFLAAYTDAVVQLGEIDPGLRMRAEGSFMGLVEANSPASFAAKLLDHHANIQKAKPPNGKRAWFDLFGDERVAIRPAYTVSSFAPTPESYVHTYRCKPLISFARQLGRVSLGEAVC